MAQISAERKNVNQTCGGMSLWSLFSESDYGSRVFRAPKVIVSVISSTNLICSWFGEAIAPFSIIGLKSKSSAPLYVDSTHCSAQKPVIMTVSMPSSLSFSANPVLLKELP